MKKFYLLLLAFTFYQGMSQSTNDILNVLINQKIITQEQADSLRADAAIKQQETDANKKSFLVTAARQIQLSALTQVRFQDQDEKGKKDGFDIRRARLDLKGNLTPFLYFRFQTEFAVNPKILDAYSEIRIKDYLILP